MTVLKNYSECSSEITKKIFVIFQNWQKARNLNLRNVTVFKMKYISGFNLFYHTFMKIITHTWHYYQGKLVTCRKMSIPSFLRHLSHTFKTLRVDANTIKIGYLVTELWQICQYMKQKNLNTVFANISKTISGHLALMIKCVTMVSIIF